MEEVKGIKSFIKDAVESNGQKYSEELANDVLKKYNNNYDSIIGDIAKENKVKDVDAFRNDIYSRYDFSPSTPDNTLHPTEKPQIKVPELAEKQKQFRYNPRVAMGMPIEEAKQIAGSVADENIENRGNWKGFGKELGLQGKSSVNDLTAAIYGTPGFVYDFIGSGFRALNIPVPEWDESLFTKDATVGKRDINPLSILEKDKDILLEASRKNTEEVIKLNPDYIKGVQNSFAEGDVDGGIRNLLSSVTRSAAPSAAMMLTGGMSAPAAMGTTSAVFGSMNLNEADQLGEYGNLSRDGVVAVSALTGAIEYIFERNLGSGAAGNAIKKLITEKGEDVAKQQIKKTWQDQVSNMIIRNPWMAPFGEAYEEMGTQLAQNTVNKFSGYMPDIKITDGMVDAGLMGTTSGGIHMSMIKAIQQGVNASGDAMARNQVKKEYNKSIGLLEDIPDANYTEAVYNLTQNYTDPQQLFDTFQEINQSFNVSQEDFLKAYEFVLNSARYTQMSKSRAQQIEEGINKYSGTDGNVTTATIDDQEWYIKNPEDLGKPGKIIFAQNESGTKAVQSVKIKPGDWLSQTPDEVRSTISQEDEMNEQLVQEQELIAEQQQLLTGVEEGAKIVNDQSQGNLRIVEFSNGQSKAIEEGQELIFDTPEELQGFLSDYAQEEIKLQQNDIEAKKADIESRREEELKNRKGNTISQSEIQRRFIQKRDADEAQNKLLEGLNQASGGVNENKRFIDSDDAIFEELVNLGVTPDEQGIIRTTDINKVIAENEAKIKREINQEIKNEGLKRVTDEFRFQDDTKKIKEIQAKYDAELAELEKEQPPVNIDELTPEERYNEVLKNDGEEIAAEMLLSDVNEIRTQAEELRKAETSSKKDKLNNLKQAKQLEAEAARLETLLQTTGEKLSENENNSASSEQKVNQNKIQTVNNQQAENSNAEIVNQNIQPEVISDEQNKQLPYFEDAKNIPVLAQKIVNGEQITDEDKQLQTNFPKELEKELKRQKRLAALQKKANKPQKPRKLSKVRQDAVSLEVYTPREIVLQYLAGHGKINMAALQSIFGNKKGKSVESERRRRISYYSAEGMGVNEMAHMLWENSGDQIYEKYDSQDFREAVEDVILSFNSSTAMAKELLQNYQTIDEQMMAEAEAMQQAEDVDDAEVDQLEEQAVDNIENNPLIASENEIDNVILQDYENGQGNTESEDSQVSGTRSGSNGQNPSGNTSNTNQRSANENSVEELSDEWKQDNNVPFRADLEITATKQASEDLRNRPNALKALQKLSELFNIKVNIIHSTEMSEKAVLASKGINGTPKAYYDPDTKEAYIISDMISKDHVSDVKKSFFHEAILHKGLDLIFDLGPITLLGKKYKNKEQFLSEVFKRLDDNTIANRAKIYAPDFFAKSFEFVNGRYQLKKGATYDSLSEAKKQELAEETLAELNEIEDLQNEINRLNNIDKLKAGSLSRLKALVDSLWRHIKKLAGWSSKQFTRRDLIDMLAEHRKLVKQATGTKAVSSPLGGKSALAGRGSTRFQAAWHGSPHAFDKFSTNNIGTGEGNQSYGWGLYFTDKKGIAESYANNAGNFNTILKYKGKEVDKNSPIGSAWDILTDSYHGYNTIKKAIRRAKDLKEYVDDNPKMEQFWDDVVNVLENSSKSDFEEIPSRNLYKVKIHGDKTLNELNFLRWEKELKEGIKENIVDQYVKEEIIPDKEANKNYMLLDEMKDINTGADLYGFLTQQLNSDKAASEFLLRSGIDGIQYPTEYTSKGEHEDSFNYVVFDENAVEIEDHIRFRADGQINREEFQKQLEEKYPGLKLFLGGRDDILKLSEIQLPKEQQGKGTGTEVMNEITDWADKNDLTVSLTPSTDYGATSVSRLKKFYKRFGFVENKGRNKDFTVSDSMLRTPRNDIRFKVAGEWGAYNIDRAEETSLRINNLGVAKQMEQDGKSPKEIKIFTGWERGADKLWRYEISDGKWTDTVQKMIDTQRKNNIPETWGLAYPRKVAQLINDAELFEAYPDIKELPVHINIHKDNSYSGSYKRDPYGLYPENDKITVNANSFDKALSILNHEIQHYIQDVEKFAQGGSTNRIKKMHFELMEGINFYNEILSKAHREGNKELYEKAMIEKLNKVSELQHIEGKYGLGPSQAYQRLAGEVEARNVQARMNLTPEERLTTLLEETEDIAREDQIFIKEGLNSGLREPEIRFRTEEQSKVIQDAKKYDDVNDFIDAYEEANFRDMHRAPGNPGEYESMEERMDEGTYFNLAEVAQGYSVQPDDYFDPKNGPRWYGYNDYAGMQSYRAIREAFNKIQEQLFDGEEISDMPTLLAYRAVPNNVDTDVLHDGDWITFSEQYAIDHGEHRFGEDEYKIIVEEVPADQVWWDGNDINEWGYDTGETEFLGRSDLIRIWNEANTKPKFRAQTETKAFKDWFGDSKVVDEEGKPLVVYHGTGADFNEFKSTKFPTAGYFAKTPDIANVTAMFNIEYNDKPGSIVPVYLSLQNPINLNNINGDQKFSVDELPIELKESTRNKLKQTYKHPNPIWSYLGSRDLIEDLKSKGYDGILYKEGEVDEELNQYRDIPVHNTEAFIAFSPTQIKSATGNNGEFDSDNPDIRFRQDGSGYKTDIFDNEISAMRNFRKELEKKYPELNFTFSEAQTTNSAYLKVHDDDFKTLLEFRFSDHAENFAHAQLSRTDKWNLGYDVDTNKSVINDAIEKKLNSIKNLNGAVDKVSKLKEGTEITIDGKAQKVISADRDHVRTKEVDPTTIALNGTSDQAWLHRNGYFGTYMAARKAQLRGEKLPEGVELIKEGNRQFDFKYTFNQKHWHKSEAIAKQLGYIKKEEPTSASLKNTSTEAERKSNNPKDKNLSEKLESSSVSSTNFTSYHNVSGSNVNNNSETNNTRFKVEPVDVNLFKYGEGGTKGLFQNDNGTLFKSLVGTWRTVENGEIVTKYSTKDTNEYEMLKALQGNPNIPVIGERVETNEGPAFEIEKLEELTSLNYDEYNEIKRILLDLNNQGYFVNDIVSVMKRPKTGELVIVDFSSGFYNEAFKGESYYSDASGIHRLYDMLSAEDQKKVKDDRDRELQRLFSDRKKRMEERRAKRKERNEQNDAEVKFRVNDSNTVYSSLLKNIKKGALITYLQDNDLSREEINDVMNLNDTYWIDEYLSDTYGISVTEKGFVQFDELTPEVKKIVGNNEIQLYHHTASGILSGIQKNGLQQSDKDVNRNNAENLGVYLTNEYSGPAADGYKYNAVQAHGGFPLTLEVVTTIDQIQPDANDADISSGRKQFVVQGINPEDILNLPDVDTESVRFKVDNAAQETNTNPTEPQKHAGNYKMGHVRFDGFDISIENPKGSIRSGKDKTGREWQHELPTDYGYFRGTKGRDKDHIDVFIGPKPENDRIYVVDQIDPTTGNYDEAKVMLGFDNISQARNTYLAAYETGWKGLGEITRTDKAGLKEWFQSEKTTKPFFNYATSEQMSPSGDEPSADGGGVRFAIRSDNPEIDQLFRQLDKLQRQSRASQRLKGLKTELEHALVFEKPDIQKQIKDLKEGIRLGHYHAKDRIKEIQKVIIDYARRNMPYDEVGKRDMFAVINKIRDAQTPKAIEKAFEKIDEITKENESNKNIRAVERLIKWMTNFRQKGQNKEGKFTYETVKEFEEFKRIHKEAIALGAAKHNNKSTPKQKAEADKALEAMWQEIDQKESKSLLDLTTMKLIELRRNGRKASKELIQAIREDLQAIYDAAKDAKTAEDIERVIYRKEDRDFVKQFLDGQPIQDRKRFDRWMSETNGFLANSMGNWETILTMMGGYKLRDKYSLILNQVEMEVNTQETFNEVMETAMKGYGLKTKKALQSKINEMKKKEYSIVKPIREGDRGEGSDISLSKLMIIDIYNAIQNEKIREDYYFSYGDLITNPDDGRPNEILQRRIGKERIDKLMENLNEGDIIFAKAMQQAAESYWGKMNDVFIRTFNRDLPKRENYWPSTAEFQNMNDAFEQSKQDSLHPSSTKELATRRTPLIADAFEKFARHIKDGEWYTNMAIPVTRLNNIFKNPNVKDLITDKYGEDFHELINKHLAHQGLRPPVQSLLKIEKAANWLLDNWIVSAIGLTVTVPAKQLLSVVNYTENMPPLKWATGFIKAMANPAKTWKEMMETVPYLKVRLGTGYSEAVQNALNSDKGTSKASSIHKSIKKWLTIGTRYGDIAAIIFGGKPYLDYLLSTGMDQKEAVDQFLLDTLRSQQAPFSSTLSLFQNSKTPWKRAMFAFSNTPSQYNRKLIEGHQAYKRGDISAYQWGKVISIYGIINNITWVAAGMFFSNLLSGRDEWDEFEKSLGLQIAISLVGGLPGIKDAVDLGGRLLTGLHVYESMNPIYEGPFEFADNIDKAIRTDDIDKTKTYLLEAAKYGSSMIGIGGRNVEKIYKATIKRAETMAKADEYEVNEKLKELSEPKKKIDAELNGMSNYYKKTRKNKPDYKAAETAHELKYAYSGAKSKATKLEGEGKKAQAEHLREAVIQSKANLNDTDFTLRDIEQELKRFNSRVELIID